MAEADPEDLQGDPEKQISVLILALKWQFDTYGISTITKSLVNNLRLFDPEAKCIKITCAVLTEIGNIEESELRDAEKHGVQLVGAKQPRGKQMKPKISWLNEHAAIYYQHVILETKYDFIIGHMPQLADGCFNLRDQSIQWHEGHSPKVILVAHALPLTEDGDVDEECLTEADFVLSVGDSVWERIDSLIPASERHKLYFPAFPLDFFKVERRDTGEVRGEQNILLMTTERETPESVELDFDLAVASSAQASENIMFHEGSNPLKQISFSLKVFGSKDEDKDFWEKYFQGTKEKHNIIGNKPRIQFLTPKNIERLTQYLRRATILILPLKPESSLYGTEALVAMAAGVPVLVSRNSGIASFLHRTALTEPVVWDNEGFTKDIKTWKERLIQKITSPKQAQKMATELRQLLLLDTNIASSHLNFSRIIMGMFIPYL